MNKKKRTGRKLFSFLLTLAMVFGLMPGMSLTAYADDTIIYVGGTNLSSGGTIFLCILRLLFPVEFSPIDIVPKKSIYFPFFIRFYERISLGNGIQLSVGEILLFLWGIVMIFLLIQYGVRYYRSMKGIRATSEKDEYLSVKLSESESVGQNISIFKNRYIDTPISAGLLYPSIIIPEKWLKEKDIHFMIEHELAHIKNGDLIGPNGIAGMDATGIPISQRHKIIKISEASRQEMFDETKRHFLQENGIVNGDTTKRSEVFRNYQLSVKKEDRLKGSWTLGQYERAYRQAFYEAAKSADPTWKAGKPIPPGALDGITSDFAKNYNETLDAVKKADNSRVTSSGSTMSRMTNVMKNSLAQVGVTVGDDGKLSVDEMAFKNADISKVKSMFNGSGSYAGIVSSSASRVESQAVYQMNRSTDSYAGLYGRSGYYNSFLSGSYFNAFF